MTRNCRVHCSGSRGELLRVNTPSTSGSMGALARVNTRSANGSRGEHLRPNGRGPMIVYAPTLYFLVLFARDVF